MHKVLEKNWSMEKIRGKDVSFFWMGASLKLFSENKSNMQVGGGGNGVGLKFIYYFIWEPLGLQQNKEFWGTLLFFIESSC